MRQEPGFYQNEDIEEEISKIKKRKEFRANCVYILNDMILIKEKTQPLNSGDNHLYLEQGMSFLDRLLQRVE